MDIKQYFKGDKARVIWINIALMIAALILFPVITLYYIDHYTNHGDRVEVPSVDRMTIEDAEATLNENGLIAIVTDSVKKDGYEPGTVCMQSPSAGSEVKHGRMVYLTVIRTQEVMITFPNVAGNCSVDEARQMLYNLGFTFTEDKIIESPDRGLVINVYQGSRKLAAGMSVSTKQPLTLYVGSGVQEDTLSVDDSNDDDFDLGL